MKAKAQEKSKNGGGRRRQCRWHEMNRKQRREMMRKMQSEDLTLEVVYPDAAGIDIGNESHYVAVPPIRDTQPVQRFGCTTAELKAMANWLKQCRIRTVAMQSTGVYWIAVFDILGIPHAALWDGIRGPRGRLLRSSKSSTPGQCSEAERHQARIPNHRMQLHTYGLLRNSFRPSPEIRRMRTYRLLRPERKVYLLANWLPDCAQSPPRWPSPGDPATGLADADRVHVPEWS
jgi:hypothetical protein